MLHIPIFSPAGAAGRQASLGVPTTPCVPHRRPVPPSAVRSPASGSRANNVDFLEVTCIYIYTYIYIYHYISIYTQCIYNYILYIYNYIYILLIIIVYIRCMLLYMSVYIVYVVHILYMYCIYAY